MTATTLIKGTFATLLFGVVFTACDIAVKLTRPDEPTHFEYVCGQIGEIYGRAAEMECRLLDEPIVIVSDVLNGSWCSQTIGEYYVGEPYVFIAKGLDPEEEFKTKRHEITHYVTDHLGLIDEDDNCEHERIARLIADEEWGPEQKQYYWGCSE